MNPNSTNSITIAPDTHPKHGRIWKITAKQTLPRPIDEVFPFFSDAFNLERLTPTFLGFKVLTPKPIDLKSGTVINYRLKIHHIPIRWKTTILDWNPPHSFVDNQDQGPYTLWHHTHSFTPTNQAQSTLCTDTVLYKPKGWILAPLINKFFVQRDVKNIFEYRFQKLSEIFPNDRADYSSKSSSLAAVN
ncbi:MAG: SRPBCC family protein [Phycisphaerales bacterium]